jgi:hypothetical protein
LPFIYLDAHFFRPNEHSFPIEEELRTIKKGVVCIGDFFIGESAVRHYNIFGDERAFKMVYHYDSLNETKIDLNLVDKNIKSSTPLYVNNAANLGAYPLPSHQFNRRAGRGYFVIGDDRDLFSCCEFFAKPTY